MNITVHGATGSQGSPVAALLTSAGHRVRPATRASGVDLLEPASLAAAYDGADAVVLQLPLVYDERALEMAANAARAAERAGIEHLVVNASTPVPPEPIGVPFIDARLIAAGAHVPRVTLLQPLTYMENLLGPWSAVPARASPVTRCRLTGRCTGSPPPTSPVRRARRSSDTPRARSRCPGRPPRATRPPPRWHARSAAPCAGRRSHPRRSPT